MVLVIISKDVLRKLRQRRKFALDENLKTVVLVLKALFVFPILLGIATLMWLFQGSNVQIDISKVNREIQQIQFDMKFIRAKYDSIVSNFEAYEEVKYKKSILKGNEEKLK